VTVATDELTSLVERLGPRVSGYFPDLGPWPDAAPPDDWPTFGAHCAPPSGASPA